MGRPKKVLDYDVIERLAGIMCTQEEIAEFINVSTRTLQRDPEFCRIYKKGIDKGKISLRRTQFRMAESNATMAIWLGKQYLNQTDKIENRNTDTINTNVSFSNLSEEQIKRLLDEEDEPHGKVA